ncbi:proline--tRNA ligase [Ureaplasma ceti]|uniref:Proline--tRNA ligase n=1 Tax=Ureaplasma ceti TaxID=3119530 RepID=A0ABP9U6L2_9BACT
MSENNKIVLDKIVTRSENFADWYTSIVHQAKLIQYSDVKGFMIFQPNGWALWENIKNILDKEFKKMNVKNVYMPLLIPISEFQKEKDHVEGFAPELFTINQIGSKTLEEPLAIRPTSEILFCKYFKSIVNSYKDLPVKLNQWTSVLRAEKTTRPFLRNSEFHWHETHCVFETREEADQFTRQHLDLYADFCEKELCIPVIKGVKTPGERFAGADNTYTIESMMQDGQALQSATSHLLGQNFAKAFGITYQSKDNKLEIPYTTSHGLSTRIIGALIMVHSDDKGLVLPPAIAPTQIRILPLFADKNPAVLETANQLKAELDNNYRVEIDNSGKGFGYMMAQSEVEGVPLTIAIGPKDIANNKMMIVRRDTNEKLEVSLDNVSATIDGLIADYKQNIFAKAKQHLDSSIEDVNTIEELKAVVENKKWARMYFDGSIADEKKVKELTGATPRCIVSTTAKEGKCFMSGKPTQQLVIFARAY